MPGCIFTNGPDPISRESVCCGVGGKPVVFVLGGAAIIGPHPQASVPSLKQQVETIALDSFGIAFVEDGKAKAIKANQPVRSCKPEVAVLCLQNRLNGILRQAVVRVPQVELI